MISRVCRRIGNLDFAFEHSTAKIVANRTCQEIKLAGLTIGPFDEGSEYETYFWIAHELEKSGIVRLREDESIVGSRLSKFHWTERIQSAGQMSTLPDGFYSKLRRCLQELKAGANKAPERMLEYEKARHLTRDIVNSRVKKIVSIASAPAQTEQTLKNLTTEERFLYEQLYALVSEWRREILEYRWNEE